MASGGPTNPTQTRPNTAISSVAPTAELGRHVPPRGRSNGARGRGGGEVLSRGNTGRDASPQRSPLSRLQGRVSLPSPTIEAG